MPDLKKSDHGDGCVDRIGLRSLEVLGQVQCEDLVPVRAEIQSHWG
jgi:hypothetical protein